MTSHPKAWERRAERHPCWHPVQLLRENHEPVRAFVSNLSGEGLHLSGCLLQIGDICQIVTPDENVYDIEVRWVAGGRCGARFTS